MKSDLKSIIHLLNNEQKKKIIYEIADIISTLHSKNITHNDLKCENILVDENNRIYLSDFGIVREVLIQMNTNGSGTDGFKPKECYEGIRGKFTDSYGFGMILYELLEGKSPFHQIDPNLLITEILQDSKPLFTKSSTEMKFYEELMMKCWSSDYEKRPQFTEILNDLRGQN